MYRWAEDADKAAVMKLWATEFESYEPYYSWYFDAVYRPELTLCDFAGCSLAANLQLAPYTLRLRGADLPICYMVGVITDTAFRGQGRGAALLKQAHAYLRQQGYAASLLYTDIPGFYAPLGYSHCYGQQTLRLPVAALSLAEVETACLPLREQQMLAQIPALENIYGRMTANYDGYISRDGHNWRMYLGEQACDQARLLLAEEQAYIIYVPQPERWQVVEIGFVDEQALQSALASLVRAAVQAGASQLLWHAPDNAQQLLPQVPARYWQTRPFVMARLQDWRLALSSMAYPRQVNAEIALTVREEGQEACVILSIAHGRAQLRDAAPGALPHVSLDIAMLTRLVFGVTGTAFEATAHNALTYALLKEIFPPSPLWVNEYT